jgi:hypothetical protein
METAAMISRMPRRGCCEPVEGSDIGGGSGCPAATKGASGTAVDYT